MVVNIKSMAHVCSNTFLSIFLRRNSMVFGKMSLLHWLTKLTHQTLSGEKIIGEVFWRQWYHSNWTLKTVSEIPFCVILTTGFVIRTWFTETILIQIINDPIFITIIAVPAFVTFFFTVSVIVLVFLLSLLLRLVWFSLLLLSLL